MHCTSCGTRLPAGMAACPACAMLTPYNISTPVVNGSGDTTASSFYSTPFPPPPTPVMPPGPARPRSPLGVTTVLLLILTLLIMASGIGLIFYSAVLHPAQIHAQASATAQSLQTVQAQITSTANAQATGTVQAEANATATAQ